MKQSGRSQYVGRQEVEINNDRVASGLPGLPG
jgi:hypothetical protein